MVVVFIADFLCDFSFLKRLERDRVLVITEAIPDTAGVSRNNRIKEKTNRISLQHSSLAGTLLALAWGVILSFLRLQLQEERGLPQYLESRANLLSPLQSKVRN